MDWQPIETAPKDGRPVLLYYPEGIWEDDWNDYEGRFLPDCAVMRWDRECAARVPTADCWFGYYEAIGPNGSPTLWAVISLPHIKD